MNFTRLGTAVFGGKSIKSGEYSEPEFKQAVFIQKGHERFRTLNPTTI